MPIDQRGHIGKDRDCDGVANAIDNAEERDLRQEASSGYSTGSEVLITHERHKAAVDRAANLAQQAIRDLERGLSFDLVAITVREAITELSLITGDDVSETLIEMIFNRFVSVSNENID